MKIVCALIYIGMAILTFSGDNAAFQYDCHHRWNAICDWRMVRRDRTHALLDALIPPWWIMVMISTGFYEDGFSFSATPHVQARD